MHFLSSTCLLPSLPPLFWGPGSQGETHFLPFPRGGISKEAKPLTQDQPAFIGTTWAQLLAFAAAPVTHKALLLPKADIADRAAVDLLLPVSLLMSDQPRE